MIDYVQFFPTLRCNRKCSFCFSRNLSYGDFPKSRILELVKFLEKNKIGSLDILGGEPFLYGYLELLIEEVLCRGIEITISTNGTMADKIKSVIETFGNQNLKIGISVDEPPSHDLKKLIEKHKFWIKSVIRRDKLPEKETLEFAKNAEIKYYFIYMDALTKTDLENSLSFVEFMNIFREYGKYYSKVEPVYCKGFIGGNRDYRCPAGTDKISVMPDGSVYPCYLLANRRDYYLGNIFDEPLHEIIESTKLKIFKVFKGNLCHNRECDFFLNCKGGCVAHSVIHYGAPYKGDPRCKTNKSEF